MLKDTLFWTFSTVVQSFVAYVSLLGMVGVYKLQKLRSNKEHIAESMRNNIKYFRGAESDGYSIDKLVKDIKGITNDIKNDKHFNITAMKRALLEINNIEKEEINIKIRIKQFFYITIFLLICSLFLLPLSQLIGDELGKIFLIIILTWSTISFISGLFLILELIEYPISSSNIFQKFLDLIYARPRK